MNNESIKSSRTGAMAFYLAILIVFSIGCASTATSMPKNSIENLTKLKLITGITAYEDGHSANVLVNADRQLTYTSVKQPSPLSVILYFPKTALDKNKIQSEIRPESDTLGPIRTSELTEKGHTARIEIALKQDVTFSTSIEDSGMKVSFAKPLKPVVATKPKEINVASLADKGKVKPPTQPKEKPALAATRLESIYALQSDKGVKIKVMADGTINNYKEFTVDKPARIVFDIYNVKQDQQKEQSVPINSKWVKTVRHFAYPDKLRIVLDTEKMYLSSYSAASVKNGLLIQMGPGQAPKTAPEKKPIEIGLKKPPVTAVKAETVKTEPPGRRTTETSKSVPAKTSLPAVEKKPAIIIAKSEPPVATKKVELKSDKTPAWVNRIDFSSEEAGKSTIIIGTTKPVKYDLKKVAEKRLQLKLMNTKLPDYRKRPLVTTRFESAIDRILPFETPELENTSLFSIELREAVPYFVEQTDNLLMVHFEASSVSPKPMDKAKLPSWEKVVAETTVTAAAKPKMKEKPTGAAAPSPGVPSKYTGEKIALDFFETDIKNVFRILREVSKKNFAIDRGVGGKVTLTLEKPVPWDQVLDLILKMNGLGMTMEGDIIRIAKRSTLAKEEAALKKKIAAEKKLMRQEKKEIKELEPLVTEYISINYANAKSEVLPKVKPILTPKRGKIVVDDRNNQLIITDVADKIVQAKKIVRQIDKVTPQVLIEARIVEATNTFTRSVGVRWEMTGGPSNFISGSDLSYEISAINPPTSSLGLIGINFSRIVGTPFSIIDAQLSASETQGDLNIISAPRVLTLNNKKATIRQGVRYPYNKLVDGETRTEFIDVDLKLEVEPLVTPDKRISMKLFVSNNEIGAVINNAQSFTTKEANTELLVNDGETVVIGGIRKTTKRNDISGVPVFKDVPVLGWLFKSKGVTDNKEELLIFITPTIVQLEQRG